MAEWNENARPAQSPAQFPKWGWSWACDDPQCNYTPRPDLDSIAGMTETATTEEIDTPRYRKRAKHASPKKSNHKHDFHPCVYEYPSSTQATKTTIGTYCPICGKIGRVFDSDQCVRPLNYPPTYTEAAKKELDPATRTLPTFPLEDPFRQKYIKQECPTCCSPPPSS